MKMGLLVLEVKEMIYFRETFVFNFYNKDDDKHVKLVFEINNKNNDKHIKYSNGTISYSKYWKLNAPKIIEKMPLNFKQNISINGNLMTIKDLILYIEQKAIEGYIFGENIYYTEYPG